MVKHSHDNFRYHQHITQCTRNMPTRFESDIDFIPPIAYTNNFFFHFIANNNGEFVYINCVSIQISVHMIFKK